MIEKMLIKNNFGSRKGVKISYIVIHDTGNTNKTANAINHFKYFNTPNVNASSHYVIDEDHIIQLVEDKNSSYHCGDGKGRFGITNSNSIGIELCVNEGNDWYKTKEKAILLIRILLNEYNLDKKNVVRHFDASLKICPRKMSESGWREWVYFYDSI